MALRAAWMVDGSEQWTRAVTMISQLTKIECTCERSPARTEP